MKRITGFTSVELGLVLVVVGVIGLLVFNSYATYLASARDAQRVLDLGSIAKALQMYQIEHRSFPVIPPESTSDPNQRGVAGFHYNTNTGLSGLEMPCDPSLKERENWISLQKQLESYLDKLPLDPLLGENHCTESHAGNMIRGYLYLHARWSADPSGKMIPGNPGEGYTLVADFEQTLGSTSCKQLSQVPEQGNSYCVNGGK